MQSTRLRAAPDAQSTAFGDLLCRLRLATQVTVERERLTPRGRVARWKMTTSLTQTELARRAGLDAGVVNKSESGTYHASRATVEKLCAALELDAVSSSLLLIASGYWPWHDLDEQTALLVAQTALAVIAGDYRSLEGLASCARP